MSERPFENGEEFYSALIDVEGALERKDYATESWAGVPPDCVGWWKSKMPDLENGRVYWAPNDVLLSYFQHAVDRGDGFADMAYVMAILLVQKRILQMVENDDSTNPPTLVVHHRKTKTDYRLLVSELSAERMLELQDELAEHLFTSTVPDSGDDNSLSE